MSVEKVKIWTALVTPFNESDSLDIPSFKKLVEHQLAGGIKGLLLYGSTGEAATLSQNEKEILAETIHGIKKDASIMMGVTHNNTKIAVQNAKLAKEWGADVLLAAAPYYNKPTEAGMSQHFRAIHDATDLPLVLYNIPSRVAIDMSYALISELATLDKVIGLKEASGNLQLAQELQGQLSLWSGDDPLLLPYMSVGAVGGISVNSNLFPKEFTEIAEDYSSGRVKEALEKAKKFSKWYELVFAESNPIGIKTALSHCGIMQNCMRLPLTEMLEHNSTQIKNFLSSMGCLASTGA